MKKIFVDTNVIIDLIADRKPFNQFAIEIFNKAETKIIKLYTSSHTFSTTHYLLKKYIGEKKLREILYNLTEFITIIEINESIIKKAFKNCIKSINNMNQTGGGLNEIDILNNNIKKIDKKILKMNNYLNK